MEREKVGIKKFDKLVQGGLPQGSLVGISGPPGAGKSIFSLHFILEGARKGEKVVYINLEEPGSNVQNMINQFDFKEEFMQYVQTKRIVLKCLNYIEYEKIYTELFEKIREDKKITRVVIDSFNIFFATIPTKLDNTNEFNVRKIIHETVSKLRRENLTTLMTLEKLNGSNNQFTKTIPFMLDGMIALDFLELDVLERRIFIPKMRWTNQAKEGKNYEITKKGITILEE